MLYISRIQFYSSKIELADVNMNLTTTVFNFLEILAASYIHAFHSVLCISSVDIIFLEVFLSGIACSVNYSFMELNENDA